MGSLARFSAFDVLASVRMDPNWAIACHGFRFREKAVRNLFVLLSILALLAVSLAGRRAWMDHQQLPEGLIQANGRTEGDHVAISSKYAGRIADLMVREGAKVVQGQAVARLEDDLVIARLNQALHGVSITKAIVQGARADAAAISAEIRAARTSLRLLKKQVPIDIEIAQAELDHALAVSATADSAEGFKRSEHERAQKLIESDAISKESADQKELAWTVARNELTTAMAARVTAEKRLARAKLGMDQITEQEDAILALEAKSSKAKAHIDECIARQAEAEAALSEAQSRVDDLTITAPSRGTIVARFADAGEVVSAGSPLMDLVDLDRLYLQVYVPEPNIGQIRLGLPAKIYTDAFPDQPFDATVKYISSQAEFTPKEVQTKDERVKLVYAVRLYLDENPDHRLTPGLPADAVIRWQEDTDWAKPRW